MRSVRVTLALVLCLASASAVTAAGADLELAIAVHGAGEADGVVLQDSSPPALTEAVEPLDELTPSLGTVSSKVLAGWTVEPAVHAAGDDPFVGVALRFLLCVYRL